MSERTPLRNMAYESSKRGKDPRTRKALIIIFALWLLTLAALVGVAWNAYFQQKAKTLSLAQQITEACRSGDFGSDMSEKDQRKLCSNARSAVKDDNVTIGLRGPEGPRGPAGQDGVDGENGRNGLNGATGKTGPRGIQGLRGLMGLPGTDGADGTNGQDGAPGAPGEDGSPGPAGQDGTDGAQGPPGPAGPQGPQGPSGIVNVKVVNCEGPVIRSITALYDAETMTLTIQCNN